MKRLLFMGSSRDDLRQMPAPVRQALGEALWLVQAGEAPPDFKPMGAVGAGAYEIRCRDAAGAFRVIYVAKRADAVVVLHAFQKKTQKTAKIDLELARRRYRLMGEHE